MAVYAANQSLPLCIIRCDQLKHYEQLNPRIEREREREREREEREKETLIIISGRKG